MKDYSNYKVQFDMVDYSRRWIFEEQLKQEGSNLKVNEKATQMINGIEVPYRAIVRRHGQDHKEFQEERSLDFGKEFDIKLGDYIQYLDEIFLVNTHVDKDNPAYNCTKMIMCNNTMNAKGWDKPINCFLTNSSYGDKGVLDSTFLSSIDGKMLCYIQDNETTKTIVIDMRFIFDHDKSQVYKVVKTETVTTGVGRLRKIVLDKDKTQDEKDDFVNNIAYNAFLDTGGTNPQPTPSNSWNIISDDGNLAIGRMRTRVFSVVDSNKVLSTDNWTITVDQSGLPSGFITIVQTTSNSISIKNNGYNGSGYWKDPFKISFLRTSDNYKLEVEVRLVK
jgi:hypothetical protein